MPQLLVPVFTAIGFTGSIAGVSTAVIAANATVAALSLGAQSAMQSAAQRQARKRARRGQTSRQEQRFDTGVSPRMQHFGRGLIEPTPIFGEERDGWLYRVYAVSSGTIAGYDDWRINGRSVLVDADGAVTNKPFWIGSNADPNARSHLRFEWRRGFADQPALAMMRAAFPAEWSDQHRGLGVPLFALAAKQTSPDRYQAVFQAQWPQPSVIARGVLVHDPRVPGTSFDDRNGWVYSDNAALGLLHYLRAVMGLSDDAVNVASFAACADHCDDLIRLRGGGAERRYRVFASYSLDEPPADVIERYFAAMRGSFALDQRGRITLMVKRASAPGFTITDDAIVDIQVERGEGLLTGFNAVRAMFRSPPHDWQMQPAAIQRNAASVAELGRQVTDETSLDFVTSHSQAQRLAKIELYEDNPDWSGVMTCHPEALMLRRLADPDSGERGTFRLLHDDLRLDLICHVTSLELSSDMTTVRVGFESVSAEADLWIPDLDEGPAPVIPPETRDDPANPAAPLLLPLVQDEAGGELRGGIRWTARERPGQTYDVRHRAVGAPAWIEETGLAVRHAVTSALVAGDDYEFEVRVRTAQGGVSPWAAGAFTAAPPDSTTLPPPSGLAAADGGAVSIVQSVGVDAWSVELVAATGSSPTGSPRAVIVVSPGQAGAAELGLAAGQWNVWARSSTLLGRLTSGLVGPLALTVDDPPPPSGSSGDGGEGGGGSANDMGSPDAASAPGTSSDLGSMW
jgi:hypothetical protein